MQRGGWDGIKWERVRQDGNAYYKGQVGIHTINTTHVNTQIVDSTLVIRKIQQSNILQG